MTVQGGGEPEGSRRATDGLDWGRSNVQPQPQDLPPAAPAESGIRPPSGPVRPNVYHESSSPARQSLPPQPPVKAGFGVGAVLGIAAASALIAGIAGGGIAVLLLSDDDVGLGGDGGRVVQQVTIEETSAIADAAGKVRPSVVRIENTMTQPGRGGPERDVGSGIILDTAGHILTNAHVVLGTDELRVVLPSGEVRPAILLGHDYPFTDLAVLQVGPGGLTPIELGDSDALALGQTVLAVGNPLAQFDGSVTVGVVSGLNRIRMNDAVRNSDYIQTDAAINNGNSGGALVNLEGQFIGMPTAVVRQTAAGSPVEGISFALPSNRVLGIARQIIDGGGTIARPDIGAEHVDLNDAVLDQLPPLDVAEGAIILSVTPGGVAATAGFRPGDVITGVGGVTVNREMPLLNVFMEHTPGQTVKVVLNRQGQIIEADVRLGTR